MQKSRRGLGRSHDDIAGVAIVAILLAIFIPVFVQIYQHSIRHGANVGSAIGMVLTIFLMIFVVIPLSLAMPFICLAKFTHKRSDAFRDILLEYWARALGGLLVTLAGLALCLWLWDVVIRPAIHFLHA